MSVPGRGNVVPYVSRFVTLFHRLFEECPIILRRPHGRDTVLTRDYRVGSDADTNQPEGRLGCVLV